MSFDPTKPVHWVGSSYKDFRSFPDLVQDVMGFALYQSQIGRLHSSAKPLKGFGHGIKTPQVEINLVRRQLKAAEQEHKAHSEAL
jgi:phage-related protein